MFNKCQAQHMVQYQYENYTQHPVTRESRCLAVGQNIFPSILFLFSSLKALWLVRFVEVRHKMLKILHYTNDNQHNVHFFFLRKVCYSEYQHIYNIPYSFLRFVTRGVQNINIHKRNYLVFFIILAFLG